MGVFLKKGGKYKSASVTWFAQNPIQLNRRFLTYFTQYATIIRKRLASTCSHEWKTYFYLIVIKYDKSYELLVTILIWIIQIFMSQWPSLVEVYCNQFPHQCVGYRQTTNLWFPWDRRGKGTSEWGATNTCRSRCKVVSSSFSRFLFKKIKSGFTILLILLFRFFSMNCTTEYTCCIKRKMFTS